MKWHLRLFSLLMATIGVAMGPYVSHAQAIDDPFSDYLQRSDSILLGAGNASDANAAIQTINPWPPYAGNTRIGIDGRRSVDSVERMYRNPNPFEHQGAGGSSGASGTGPSGSSAGGGGLAGTTPVQPVSGGY